MWKIAGLILVSEFSINVSKAQTAISYSKPHDKVGAMVAGLPEVIAADAQCKKLSKGKRHLTTFIAENPTPGDKFFLVKVAEDNGSSFHSWMIFNVDSATSKVCYYDVVTGKNIPLKQWRKHRSAYI